MHCLFVGGVLDDVHVHAGSWGGEGGGGGGGVGVGLFSQEEKPCSTSPLAPARESKTEADDSAAAAETLRGELGSTPRAYNSMDSTDADVREAAPESDDWSDGVANVVISNITKDF